MYKIFIQQHKYFIKHGFQLKKNFPTKRLFSSKLSPKLIEQIVQKEEEQNGNKYPESVAIVFAPNAAGGNVLSTQSLSPVQSQQLIDGIDNKHLIGKVINEIVINDNETIKKNKKVKPIELAWMITPSDDYTKLFKQYLMLSKFRLTSLVVITTMAGYAMAPAPFAFTSFVLCAVGTGLCSAAANSINQYHEVPFDAQMSRTKNRVLVKGMLTPLHAIGFAIGSAGLGLCILNFGVNGLTAALGAANLLLYTSVYTPMKRISILNTWVGSIVGAIPPVMGWVGCSGTIDTGAWILAGLLYAWQFPHFNALSWNLRPDYSRAGYRMMSVTNPGLCRRTALRYTAVIGGLSIAAPFLDVTNMWFAIETLPLNGYFAYLAWKFYRNSDSGTSRKLFRFSLIHLPILMVLFLLNKKRWIFTETEAIIDGGAVGTVAGDTTIGSTLIAADDLTTLQSMTSVPALTKLNNNSNNNNNNSIINNNSNLLTTGKESTKQTITKEL